MPITNIAQIERITRMCGATDARCGCGSRSRSARTIPRRCCSSASRTRRLQAADLLANGAPGVHFYTLNRSRASRMIVTALQVQHAAD